MALFPQRIQTERLDLVGVPVADLDPLTLYRHCSAPEMSRVTEYLPWEPHESPKASKDVLEELRSEWVQGEQAAYVIRPREGEAGAGEFAGTCGLVCEWETQSATVGVWLRPRFWGRGYAGERAAALFRLAFDRLHLEIVVSECFAGNDRSLRAIERYVERFGGRHEGRLRNARRTGDRIRDVHRFTVSREEWADADVDESVVFDPETASQ